MPIFQTNRWVCEACGRTEQETLEVSPYSDPVVHMPQDQGWDYIWINKKELLVCPECVSSKWEERKKEKEQC